MRSAQPSDASFQKFLTRGLLSIRLAVTILVSTGLTYGLSATGVDALVNKLARLQDPDLSIAWSAFPMFAGFAVPLLVPLVCAVQRDKNAAKATFAAFVISLIVVSLLKGISSRVHPEALIPATVFARSQVFQFGLFQSGMMSIVEGWPSGHMATNGAVAMVLARLTDLRWLQLICWFWVVWVAFATVFGISGDVHWLSDTASGCLLAVAISSSTVQTSGTEK